MSERQFFWQLGLLSTGVCCIIGLLNFIPFFSTYQQLSWLSILLFVMISMTMYYLGRWAIEHSNKHLFTSLLYGFMGGKMLLSVILIYVYNLMAQPETKLFILPFFLVYVFYTVFESYFLIKINNMQ